MNVPAIPEHPVERPDRVYTPQQVVLSDDGDLSFDPTLTELRYQINQAQQRGQERLTQRVRRLKTASNVLILTGLATIPLDQIGDMERDNVPLRVARVLSWTAAGYARVKAH